MKVLFTNEQLTEMESSAHKQVVEDDWVVVEWTYDLIKEVRFYKRQVEEMQKTMQDIHDKLNNGASHEFEETIQYCITKAFYALKGVENNEPR